MCEHVPSRHTVRMFPAMPVQKSGHCFFVSISDASPNAHAPVCRLTPQAQS
jgi:hypothetical protein